MTVAEVGEHLGNARKQIHPDDYNAWRVAHFMRPVERTPDFKVSDHGDLVQTIKDRGVYPIMAIMSRADCSRKMAKRILFRFLQDPVRS